MYNYSYEEYMNNLLGYNMNNRNNMYMMNQPMIEPMYEEENVFTYAQSNSELEECYPDIYKIVYPMVCKACMNINEDITKELVDRLTNEIYEAVENDEIMEETKTSIIKVNYSNIPNNRNIRRTAREESINDTKEEKRQRNFLLNDLIRILILRELLGNGRRPPFSYHRPGRPPFLPNRTGGRPPIF